MLNNISIGLIFLAGGKGTRMNSEVPKQFLEIGKPIALYSFETLVETQLFQEVVVVCPILYQSLFQTSPSLPITFASPGDRRQDSLSNGLLALKSTPDLIMVHDSARPFINRQLITSLIKAAILHGASCPGIPLTSTIKECNDEGMVLNTPNRNNYFEIQTPQVIRRDWIIAGMDLANKNHLTATDDVSLVEFINKPVKIVPGNKKNIKITTKEDLELVKHFNGYASL